MGKKVIIISGIVLLALMLLLCLAPVLFKKQISQSVKAEVNERINARVEYKDLSISLFRSFPDMAVSVSDFTITGEGEFQKDTLASGKDFTFTIDLISIITGRGYKVVSLHILQPALKLRVNNAGHVNWDIIRSVPLPANSSPDAKAPVDSTFLFSINNWQIENAAIEFRHDATKTLFAATGIDCNGRSKSSNIGSDFDISTASKTLSFFAGGITYLQNVKLNAAGKLSFNTATGSYEVKENVIALNDLRLAVNGGVKNTSAGPNYNLSVQSLDSAFGSLLSVIPGMHNDNVAKPKTQGNFSLQGTISGLSNDIVSPACLFKLHVNDGVLEKPGLAQAVKRIFIDATVMKPQGPTDSAVIEASRFHIQTGNDSVNGSLRITTPFADPYIMAEVKGSVDLANLNQFFGARDVAQLSGALHADLKLKGRKSDLDRKNYKLIQASGKLEVKGVTFQKQGWPVAVKVDEAAFLVAPEFISLTQLNGLAGKCKFKGTGKFDNVIPYLAKQSNLIATLSLNADTINLRELSDLVSQKSISTPRADKAGSTEVSAGKTEHVEQGVDWVIHVSANKVYDDKLIMNNVSGEVSAVNNSLRVKDVSAGLFGGKVILNATCADYTKPSADMVFSLKADNVEIARVYKSIDDAEKTMPALKYLSGPFSGDIAGSGKVKGDNCLKLDGLIADGNLFYPDLKVNEMPVLMQIGSMAKIKSLDHLEARNVKSSFHFKNGNAMVDPTDIKFTNGYKLNFKGTNFANQTIDANIALDVPVKEMGSIASLAQNLLSSFMSVPENVHFEFKITGKNTDPQVKIINVGTSGN